MLQDRIFLLFTIGIVALVCFGCVILGVTIYINLPAWLPPQAITSNRPSPGDVTRPAQAPLHLQPPVIGPATRTAGPTYTPVMTVQPATAAPLPTRTEAPVTSPASANLLPTPPPQASATPVPVESPTRLAALPTIAAIPAGTRPPSTPTATSTPGPTGSASTPEPTSSSASTPTAPATDTPTPTATPHLAHIRSYGWWRYTSRGRGHGRDGCERHEPQRCRAALFGR